MADAGSSRDATSSARNPPPGAAGNAAVNAAVNAGDVSALDRLVERALTADKSSRYAFAASLWKRAAAAATALHGGASLVAAKCTLDQADSLCCQASAEASSREIRAALEAEACALTSSVLRLVSKRMDANTLLPGRCTKEEVEFFMRLKLVKLAANNFPPLSARGLQLTGFGVGYAVACFAAVQVLLQFVDGPRPPPADLAFVLRVADMVRPARLAALGKLPDDAFVCRCCQPHAACTRLLYRRKKCACFFAHAYRRQSLTACACHRLVMHRFADTCVTMFCRPDDPFIDALRERWMAPALVAMRAEGTTRSTGRCTGRNTSPHAAQRVRRRRLPQGRVLRKSEGY